MDKILSSSLRGLALSAFALAVPAVSHAQYKGIDLGIIGTGASSKAFAINNNGFITGAAPNAGTTNTRAFLANGNLTNPVLTDLGTIGGASSNGYAINSNNVVAGSSNLSAAATALRAAYFDPTPHDAGIIGPGTTGVLRGVNNSGLAVGSSNNGQVAVTYQIGTSTTITSLAPALGGAAYSNALAVNNSGQIVGNFGTSGSSNQLFRYSTATGVLESLGTLGGTSVGGGDANAGAFGINDSGQIAGFGRFSAATTNHAFLYDNTSLKDLGTLGGTISAAYGLNTAGAVVGASQYSTTVTTGLNSYHAFIYNGSLIDLNTPANLAGSGFISYNLAFGINDSGWIVGQGITASGANHAFLLKPNVPGVPEPSSVLALGVGVLGAGAMVRRRRK